MTQNKIEEVITWRNPIETVSAMIIFSLITINPHLLLPLPLFAFMFILLIPAYLTRHPPPPSSLTNAPSDVTQPTSPPPQPAKQVPELSRDFFMNMRDIQNTMDDFSNVYDLIRAWIQHITTFSNEPLSSTLLAFTSLAALGMLLVVHLLPCRWIILVLGNALILASHPAVYRYITTTYITPEELERIKQRIDQFVQEDYIPPPAPQ